MTQVYRRDGQDEKIEKACLLGQGSRRLVRLIEPISNYGL